MRRAIVLMLGLVACEQQYWDWHCEPDQREARSRFILSCVESARSGAVSAGRDQDADDLVAACGREARQIFCVWHGFRSGEDRQ